MHLVLTSGQKVNDQSVLPFASKLQQQSETNQMSGRTSTTVVRTATSKASASQSADTDEKPSK